MMKKWIATNNEIVGRKKGSRRGFGGHTQTGKEHEMINETIHTCKAFWKSYWGSVVSI
jgi:hypothetical protein